MWQCGDVTLTRSGAMLIYINIVRALGSVVRRTKLLDFLAASA
jgi:hypothetical protein